MDSKKIIVQSSLELLKSINPLTGLVIDITEQFLRKTSLVTNEGNLEEMREEALRQEVSLKMLEAQAKLAQELSIARRIDTADEVTIEEYYDTTGEGGLGLNIKETGVALGVNGSGRSITKRIYKFKGWRDVINDNGLDKIERTIGNLNKIEEKEQG